jgi:hypothetical protein
MIQKKPDRFKKECSVIIQAQDGKQNGGLATLPDIENY